MKRIALGSIALLAPLAVQAQDLKEIVRKALLSLNSSQEKLADYGFVRHVERKEFKSDGSVKSWDRTVLKRELHDGVVVTRPVERNGKPLTESEKKQIETAIAKRVAEMKGMTPEQRRKQSETARKKDRESDAWMNEVPEAFDFKLAGEELIAGRPTLVIDATPRAGYKPSNMRAKLLPSMRGRMWIDKAEGEAVKVEAEVFEEVNIALGLAGHVDKGTRFQMERVRLPDGVWASAYEHGRFTARVMLFKSFNSEVINRTSGYVRLRNTVESAALASTAN